MVGSAVDLLTEPNHAIIITPGKENAEERDARFELACHLYQDAKVEMDRSGTIIVTPGNSEDSAYRSGEAFRQLANWAKRDGTGRAFDASANFNLPNGAKRQPDAAWVPKSVLQQEGADKLRTISKTRHVPTFLIEVTSPTDSLNAQKEKCVEWIGAGVKEVFLLHPKEKTLYAYLPGWSPEEFTEQEIPDADHVASQVLNGFVIDCSPIWEEL